jgi:5-methylcytosine-specific restriction enzyme A
VTPWAPPRPCLVPRCPHYASYRGRCAAHAHQQRVERAATSGDAFYASRAWRVFRAWFLAAHPICTDGPHQATEVDHIVGRRERPDLALDESNCRPYCKSCHSKRTARDQRGARG